MKAIHQVIIGAAPGDAITQMAVAIKHELQRSIQSEIFSVFPDPALTERVLSIHDLPLDADSALIYHSSYGVEEVSSLLLRFPGTLILVYHNITPAEYFEDFDLQFAKGLDWGRTELKLLRSRVSLSVGVSDFNAMELKMAGYSNVRTIPVGADAGKLRRVPPDVEFLSEYSKEFPSGYILAVGQLLPHKKIEDAIASTHFLRSVFGMNLGLVVVGVERSCQYAKAVSKFGSNLLGKACRFTGHISDAQLSGLMSGALCYLGLSRHEGLSIPLIEAMNMGTPAIVREAGAISETAADGALLLPKSAGPAEIADQVFYLLRNETTRTGLIARGRERSKHFDRDQSLQRFVSVLTEVCK